MLQVDTLSIIYNEKEEKMKDTNIDINEALEMFLSKTEKQLSD